jgi:hypothetical protein
MHTFCGKKNFCILKPAVYKLMSEIYETKIITTYFVQFCLTIWPKTLWSVAMQQNRPTTKEKDKTEQVPTVITVL